MGLLVAAEHASEDLVRDTNDRASRCLTLLQEKEIAPVVGALAAAGVDWSTPSTSSVCPSKLPCL